MRAFVVTAPHQGQVVDVAPPVPAADEVVVDIHRVGVCGTDVELFTGEMAYLAQGRTSYPIQPGHEWCGVVSAVGPDVDRGWVGRRVTGDTMIGCGHCERCAAGRINVCEQRREVGIRGMAGALTEQLAIPAVALFGLPDEIDDTAGALVEPGSSALRAVRAAQAAPGRRLLVLGTGTIGLLVAELARAQGAEVHVTGEDERTLELAAGLGFAGVWRPADRPERAWHAVIDGTNAASVPALALDLVEPGGRLVFIGLAGSPSLVDTRTLALKDVTAVGILGGSQGMVGTIERYAAGDVDPRPLVAATVGLERVADVLAGWRPDDAGPGPKIHIDPRG
jgi:2-desacetyl-2-hydroxyethyl bacteriochlorophyllide A dehydrogenase